MQHYYDPGMHNVWYPANHLIAHKDYPAIPRDMITLATRDDYTVVVNNKVGTMVDYLPPFVIEVMETVKGFRRFVTVERLTLPGGFPNRRRHD